MSETTTAAAPKEKKLKINIVDIKAGMDGKPVIVRYYVKHFDPRQAKAWLLENNVSARMAEQDEVIAMVKDGHEPIGPFEKKASESRFEMEPPVDEQ